MAETELGKLTLREFLARSETDGFIVLHHGRVVLEEYPRMRATDHHLMWSVSKTFASLAVAQLAAAGRVDVERPIDAYIPALAGTAWQGTRVIDILDMSFGYRRARGGRARHVAASGARRIPLRVEPRSAATDAVDRYPDL